MGVEEASLVLDGVQGAGKRNDASGGACALPYHMLFTKSASCMSTRELRIPYPEELPASAGQTPEEFEREVRFLVAAKLYELERVTSGRAAHLADIDRVEFLDRLGSYRISVWNYDPEELEREIKEARRRAQS